MNTTNQNVMMEIKNLHSGYGKLEILHGVDMEISKGELTAIVGPNGAGKSTFTMSILNLLHVNKGEIFFNSLDITKKDPSEITAMGIGYVPQTNNVFPELSVQENLEMGIIKITDKKMIEEAINDICSIFTRLKDRKFQKASTLSGGERQMLAIGSALISRPELLILDEPTTGLAPSIVDEIIDCVVQIREKGSTLLWVVGDNPMQVLPIADTIYIMNNGIIKEKKTGKEFVDEPEFAELFLGYCEQK